MIIRKTEEIEKLRIRKKSVNIYEEKATQICTNVTYEEPLGS